MRPVMAMRTGAILSMLTAAILILRAVRAPGRPYRRTETWVLLGRVHGLPEAQAQEVLALIDKLEQDDDVQAVYHSLL